MHKLLLYIKILIESILNKKTQVVDCILSTLKNHKKIIAMYINHIKKS